MNNNNIGSALDSGQVTNAMGTYAACKVLFMKAMFRIRMITEEKIKMRIGL